MMPSNFDSAPRLKRGNHELPVRTKLDVLKVKKTFKRTLLYEIHCAELSLSSNLIPPNSGRQKHTVAEVSGWYLSYMYSIVSEFL
jgi:hypothetical protein